MITYGGIARRNYESVIVTATTVEQTFEFEQDVRKIIIRNGTTREAIIALVTDETEPDTNTDKKQIVITNVEPFVDELMVTEVKYRTKIGSTVLYIYGSW